MRPGRPLLFQALDSGAPEPLYPRRNGAGRDAKRPANRAAAHASFHQQHRMHAMQEPAFSRPLDLSFQLLPAPAFAAFRVLK